MTYRFDLALQSAREDQETEIRTLRQACAERLQLIEELHRIAQERLEIIEQQRVGIQRLTQTQRALRLPRLLPSRLRRFLQRLRGNQA